ncbi:MAG: cysteine--tRNA ligase [Candidatus Marinimicrobia bacterium]|jgi:cysteinyl-tRNA synthetase|nr:cysteine--tRNA ligase [Candidatus Neomarinimicrobiota bacterium]MDP7072879.1 cysteine--tRNA ligase [Candidatus Neomarinimicrobiota bacterium]
MNLSLYNTATRKKEQFVPLQEGAIKLYTCGPTVYDYAHIGNFRTFLFEDFLKRYLILKGFDVTHVMNITDVDDKTIERATAQQMDLQSLTKKYTDMFFQDANRLNIMPADHYPAATDHIDIMIELIQQLIDKDHAYKTEDGSIYFSIKSFKEYGKLARLDMAGQQQTERVSADDYSKETPQDFALWKSWKKEDGDVGWESPWGKGRPGWHIECSAMSMHYLGQHFDIHCGGTDNIFPHHENEVAQSVAGKGSKFVNLWLHSEHLLVDGGKMSKSLGNYYRLDDLLEKDIHPSATRFALLNGHYRSRLNFTLTKATEAKKAITRIADFKERLQAVGSESNPQEKTMPAEFDMFVSALDDDLNIPEALGIFFEWLRNMNGKLDKDNADALEIAGGLAFVEKFNYLFQIFSKTEEIPEEILDLANKREKAREEQNWAESDRIRDEISQKGWTVEDTPSGSKLKKK